MFRMQPMFSLNLEQLREAGRFASPEGDDGGKEADKGSDQKPAGDKSKGEDVGGKKDGGEDGKPTDTVSRITTLVDERNNARNEAADWKAKYEATQQQIQQLQSNDQSKVVADLQKQLNDRDAATKTRFDKLLEVELSNLPEAAATAVKAIPGGSEVQFDWLIANRSLFSAGSNGKEQEKKPPIGPDNEKKPPNGGDPGASSVAKGYVESRKPQKSGFPGLTG